MKTIRYFLCLLLLALPGGLLAQGTTWQTATTLGEGQTLSGTMNENVNDHWFRIQSPGNGRVELDIEPQGGLSVRYVEVLWWDEAQQKHVSRATIWPGQEKRTLTLADAGAGTYYVRLNRNSGQGTYRLTYRFTASTYANDTEPNDAVGSGDQIAQGTTVQGHLGYRDAANQLDTDDCFRIEVPGNGTVSLTIEPESPLSVRYIDLLWWDETQQKYVSRASIWPGQNPGTLTLADAGAGTYYVRLNHNSGQGGYRLAYDFAPNSHLNDTEPNNAVGSGTLIAQGTTAQGHLGYRDAANRLDADDCFRIEVPGNGAVSLTVEPEKPLSVRYVEVLWWDEAQQKHRSRAVIWPGQEKRTLTLADAGAGTYYVRVNHSSGQGGYRLAYGFTPANYPNDSEPNDSRETAEAFSSEEMKTGLLGYRDASNRLDADDWYRLETANTTSLLINYERDTTTTLSVRYVDLVRVRDGVAQSLTSIWPGQAATSTLSLSNVEEGCAYYVRVNHSSGQGGYSLTYGGFQRAEGSSVRVSYLGRETVRLGIPSPFQVKVENIGDRPTGSFFLSIPASDDVKLLYAECPCDTGLVRLTMDDLGGEEAKCATFIVPGLKPFEQYTFTMYAEGRVEGKPITGRRPIVITGTAITVVAYVGSIASSMVVDRVVENLTDWASHKIMPEEQLEHYRRTYGLTMDQLREEKEEYNIVVHGIGTVAKDVGENFVKAVPGGAPVATVMGVVENLKDIAPAARRRFFLEFGRARHIDDIYDFMEGKDVLDQRMGATRIVSSWDPNEMCGPVGYGPENYIRETRTMNYRILFENKKEATAPAYRIRITDHLDEDVFDLATVRFGKTSHEGPGYNWRISREGNRLFWDIEGIELPPNVEAPEGEGYVDFSVDLLPDLPHGTQIRNQATIIFDYNQPIETNQYLNTLDLSAPEAQVSAAGLEGDTLVVRFLGTDQGAGIDRYKLYYAVGEGEMQYYDETVRPSYRFPVAPGTKPADYRFSVMAADYVGNVQPRLSLPWDVSVGLSPVRPSDGDAWTILLPNGIVVARGQGTPNVSLQPGLYLVRQGGKTRKVMVR